MDDGVKIRINLLGDTQVEYIDELKGYKVEYYGASYEDFIKVNKGLLRCCKMVPMSRTLKKG
ncbi:hypothetical protein QJR26_17850 (plasmid) [Clostridium baratii]